jgi:monofunctional biosynthetic peptidoglycan transglycosylase
MILFDFKDSAAGSRWSSIDDTVMGGVSSSRLETPQDGTAMFVGMVSLDNNGGFASIRSGRDIFDLGRFSGIELRVRGDGKRYKLNLKNDERFDGINFRVAFDTVAGEWTSVRLPFTSFVPTFRGRLVRDSVPLDPAQLTSIGLMISDNQPGRFCLEIETIAAYETSGV